MSVRQKIHLGTLFISVWEMDCFLQISSVVWIFYSITMINKKVPKCPKAEQNITFKFFDLARHFDTLSAQFIPYFTFCKVCIKYNLQFN